MKLISLLLLVPSLCFGQDTFRKVNLKEIEKTLSSKTEYNYPKLMERYIDKDTTLTEDEFFYLYYGQAIQEKYSPYGRGDDKKLKEILNKKGDHSEKELEKIISLSEKILKKFPFDLDYWLYITYANKMLNKESERQKGIFMYQGILKTIYSTGDGKSQETAFWVINVDNEYTMLRWLDLKFGGQQSLTAQRCDRLTVKKNDQDLDAMYFNVSILFESMSKLFDKENKK
jgi:hypothetical protein